jgi:hypothetical protein
MKPDKIVRKVDGEEAGALFIETPSYPPELWRERHKAWKADHRLPCPMPKGHMMFRRFCFGVYHVEAVNF